MQTLAMNALGWLVISLGIGAGCQSNSGAAKADDRSAAQAPVTSPIAGSHIAAPASGDPAPSAITPEYKQDIVNLCDVEHLSGADQLPIQSRNPTIAMWLGPHILTGAGHQFLVSIQPLVGMAKATALDAEAKRVGLDSCTLADEWRH